MPNIAARLVGRCAALDGLPQRHSQIAGAGLAILRFMRPVAAAEAADDDFDDFLCRPGRFISDSAPEKSRRPPVLSIFEQSREAIIGFIFRAVDACSFGRRRISRLLHFIFAVILLYCAMRFGVGWGQAE